MSMIPKTKIEWADYVWNPVWGCKMGCDFCYARKFAKRYAGKIAEKEVKGDLKMRQLIEERLREFKPTFLKSNFMQSFPKKPSVIFVGSMTDIADWDYEWMRAVLERIWREFDHRFIFLTKRPKRVLERFEDLLGQYAGDNMLFGVSVENQQAYDNRVKYLLEFPTRKLISFEPVLDYILVQPEDIKKIDWIILGVLTGVKRGSIIANDALFHLVYQIKTYYKLGTPLFIKTFYEYLRYEGKVWGSGKVIKCERHEFPKDFPKNQTLS